MIIGIETGGTKVVCGAVDEVHPRDLTHVRRIPTTAPDETAAAINRFVDDMASVDEIAGIGVASFGPVNVEPDRPRWGWVTATPKPGWADTDLIGSIAMTSRVPTVMLSDVASAALGEQTWGNGSGMARVGYATFGTGVGVGLCLDGRVLHGNGYPEMGHLLVRRHPEDDYEGCCRFHGDCLEGLASGPAVIGRWGADASSLRGRRADEALEVLGYYIAQLAAAAAYTTGIQRLIVGGGVLKAPGLYEAAAAQLPLVTGGPGASHASSLDEPGFLATPGLGGHSGVLGAVVAVLGLLGTLDRPAVSL